MASIANDPNGTRRVIVTTPAGRKTIRVGKMNDRDVAKVVEHVDYLASALATDSTPPVKTLEWLETISDRLHDRFARAGLCDAREGREPVKVLTVGDMFTAYIKRRTDLKPGTILVVEQSKRHASNFFGADRDAGTVNVAETKDFRRHLAGKYSSAYTVKMMRQTRTVWRDAVERKQIPENPFAGVKVGSTRNPARQFFVEQATIDRVIEHAPDAQWRPLIALSRYGGLRCPSEHLALTWADVDW